MFNKRLLISCALLVTSIIIWLTTDNVVFFILWISMIATPKMAIFKNHENKLN
jgi:hypothetical protein